MELRDFTPAQALFLADPFNTEGRTLFKYSFFDLVLRGIFEIYQDWRFPHKVSEEEKLYTFVKKGRYFDSYKKSRHQDLFVSRFTYGDYDYLVEHLLMRSFAECETGKRYKKNYF